MRHLIEPEPTPKIAENDKSILELNIIISVVSGSYLAIPGHNDLLALVCFIRPTFLPEVSVFF